METRPRDPARERLLWLQARPFRGLAEHGHADSPFYREELDDAGIARTEMRSLNDVRAVPVTTEEELRDAAGVSSVIERLSRALPPGEVDD